MKKNLFFTLITAATLTACTQEQGNTALSKTTPTASSEPVTPTNNTVYRVTTERLYEPYITVNKTGTQDGFEFELLNAIAAKQGFELTFDAKPWSVLFDYVKTGQTDIISSGITITPERQQEIDFSNPYFESTTVLLVSNQDSKIQNFADAKGQKIAVKKDTLQDKLAQTANFIPVYPSDNTTWLTVKSTMSNQSIATLGDLGAMNYYVTKYPNEKFRIIKDPSIATEQLAWGVKKGNTELLNKLNNGLAQLKDDGTYNKIHEKWFGKIQ